MEGSSLISASSTPGSNQLSSSQEIPRWTHPNTKGKMLPSLLDINSTLCSVFSSNQLQGLRMEELGYHVNSNLFQGCSLQQLTLTTKQSVQCSLHKGSVKLFEMWWRSRNRVQSANWHKLVGLICSKCCWDLLLHWPLAAPLVPVVSEKGAGEKKHSWICMQTKAEFWFGCIHNPFIFISVDDQMLEIYSWKRAEYSVNKREFWAKFSMARPTNGWWATQVT